MSTKQGESRYTLYVPDGYDGSKSYPAILFLHGAGERGDDGTVQSQVGLGPAIVQRGGVPAIVIFPQARKTWQADSEDAEVALKALEEAAKDFNGAGGGRELARIVTFAVQDEGKRRRLDAAGVRLHRLAKRAERRDRGPGASAGSSDRPTCRRGPCQ